jgi:hypothetical protein
VSTVKQQPCQKNRFCCELKWDYFYSTPSWHDGVPSQPHPTIKAHRNIPLDQFPTTNNPRPDQTSTRVTESKYIIPPPPLEVPYDPDDPCSPSPEFLSKPPLFPLFSTFPAGLRLLIWSHAHPGPRLLTIYGPTREKIFYHYNPQPTLLAVNRESRDSILKEYVMMKAGHFRLYFNPSKDSIYYFAEFWNTRWRY